MVAWLETVAVRETPVDVVPEAEAAVVEACAAEFVATVAVLLAKLIFVMAVLPVVSAVPATVEANGENEFKHIEMKLSSKKAIPA